MGAPFGLQDKRSWHSYLQQHVPRKHLITLARLRMCDWPLEVSRRKVRMAEGWVDRPRSDRLCRLCGQAVEDEKHVMFECSAYSFVRRTSELAIPNGPLTDDQAQEFLRNSAVLPLAHYVNCIWTVRRSRLNALVL